MEWLNLLTPGAVVAVALAAWRWLPTKAEVKAAVAQVSADVAEVKADVAEVRAEVGQLRADVHAIDKRLAVVEYAVGVTRPAPPPVIGADGPGPGAER